MSAVLPLLLALLIAIGLAMWGLHSTGSNGRARRLTERFAAYSLPHARVRMASRLAHRAPQRVGASMSAAGSVTLAVGLVSVLGALTAV